jgi:hypothetical protein
MSDTGAPTNPPPPPSVPGAPTPHDLKGALKAFKKRIKVMRLDNESGKMAGPLSSGKSSSIVAITPPSQFPREVWEALVKQGKLTDEGHGMYQLVDGA